MAVRLASLILVGWVSVALSGCSALMPGIDHNLAYLRADYPRMVVEIDYQAGKAPRQEAVSLLQVRIEETCHKPEGVQIDREQIDASSTTWTADSLRALEKKNRDTRTGSGTASLYVLYLGGEFRKQDGEGRVIGVRYTDSSIAIFKDTLEQAAAPVALPLFTAADVERSVLIHEFGHALGLVNLETKMQTPHEDPNNRGHSNNKDSVMYWAIESDAIARFFQGPPPTQFDANDKADLRAAGGK